MAPAKAGGEGQSAESCGAAVSPCHQRFSSAAYLPQLTSLAALRAQQKA